MTTLVSSRKIEGDHPLLWKEAQPVVKQQRSRRRSSLGPGLVLTTNDAKLGSMAETTVGEDRIPLDLDFERPGPLDVSHDDTVYPKTRPVARPLLSAEDLEEVADEGDDDIANHLLQMCGGWQEGLCSFNGIEANNNGHNDDEDQPGVILEDFGRRRRRSSSLELLASNPRNSLTNQRRRSSSDPGGELPPPAFMVADLEDEEVYPKNRPPPLLSVEDLAELADEGDEDFFLEASGGRDRGI